MSWNAPFSVGNFLGGFENASLEVCLRIPMPSGAVYSGRISRRTIQEHCLLVLSRYSVRARRFA